MPGHFGVINAYTTPSEEFKPALYHSDKMEWLRQSFDNPHTETPFNSIEDHVLPQDADFSVDYPELVVCTSLNARISCRACQRRQEYALEAWNHYLRYKNTTDLGDLSDSKLAALMTCSGCVNRQTESKLPLYGNLIQILWCEFEVLLKYISEFDWDGMRSDPEHQRQIRREIEKRHREKKRAEAVEEYSEILNQAGGVHGPEMAI
ncbi:MAG: hypothetical protein EHM41_00245 [Chloroflexi bacterium]|nr:MAG: hypothetical protein EHM41_00245 [Chloroflexota bacterium]